MLRSTKLIALVVAAMTGTTMLTGCNAASKPLIAIAAGAGHPAVVVRLCNGTATIIGLHRLANEPTSTAAGIQLWVITNQKDQRSELSVDLFSTPDGWRQTLKSADSLDPSVSYSIDVLASAFPAMALDFTVADLRRLGPDQVWALQDTTSTGAVLSRSDFDHNATKSCVD